MKRRLLLGVACLGLLAGCQRKAEGQTVAIVNGQEITLPELNFELSNAQIPQGADQKAIRAQVLQAVISRSLLAQAAREAGVDKTPDFLNRQRRGTDDLLISMMTSRLMNTAEIPSDSEISAYIAAHPGMFANRQVWTLDQLTYAQPTDKGILAEIEASKDLAALGAILQKHGIEFVRQRNAMNTSIIPADLFGRISTLPSGEPFIIPVNGRAVASVIVSKEAQPLTGDAAKPVVVAAMRKERSMKALSDQVKALKAKAKIEYKPGFEPPK